MDRVDLADSHKTEGLSSGAAICSLACSQSCRYADTPILRHTGTFLSVFLCLIVGCSTRQTAAPSAPSYPAVPVAAVRVLDKLPSPPYDTIGTITIQVNADINRDQIIAEIRKKAGNAGANTIVIMSEKVFTHRIETTRQRMRLRRIIARELRSADGSQR